jgi:dihydrofolate synthase/folylpolyglutamate synthase
VAIDVAVVEVGLLGRWDATNVVDATVAVVTNIGHDHSDFEGDWRARIASEKAGIIKPGSTLVLGETDPDLRELFVAEGPAAVLERNVDFGCDRNEVAIGGRLLDLRTPAGSLEEVFLPLHGEHQGDNAAIALAAAEAFFARGLDETLVVEAFRELTVPGRFEVVSRTPLVVLDSAHNIEGAASAAATLAEEFAFSGSPTLVVGMLRGRDPREMLLALDAPAAGLVIACTPPSPRGVPAAELAEVARELGVAVEVVPDVVDAVDRAVSTAGLDDAVLVTGSFYVVGAARAGFGVQNP